MKKLEITKLKIVNDNPNLSQEEAISMIAKALRQRAERDVAIIYDGKSREELRQEWRDFTSDLIETKGDAVGWSLERRKEVRDRVSDEIRERFFAGKIKAATSWMKEDLDQAYEISRLVVAREF